MSPWCNLVGETVIARPIPPPYPMMSRGEGGSLVSM